MPVTPPLFVPQTIADKFKVLVNRLKSFQNFNNPRTAERIILEYVRENGDLLGYIRTAAVGVAIVVGTIVDDFATAGVGIVDDVPCFIMAYKIIRLTAAL